MVKRRSCSLPSREPKTRTHAELGDDTICFLQISIAGELTYSRAKQFPLTEEDGHGTS